MHRAWIMLLIAAGCAKMPPLATALDAERANVDLASLQNGREVYIQKCKGCHGLPMPTDYSPAEWPKKVGDMAERSKIDDAQRRAIEQYLVVMSTPSPKPK
jgi:mono/diheme cytochrome c family protein